MESRKIGLHSYFQVLKQISKDLLNSLNSEQHVQHASINVREYKIEMTCLCNCKIYLQTLLALNCRIRQKQ